MALINSNMIKTVVGNTDLSLAAQAGRSLLVKDIFIGNPLGTFLTVVIEKATVGYFRIGTVLGSHLALRVGELDHAHDWVTTATAAADQTSFASLAYSGGGEVAAKMIGGLTASTTYKEVGGTKKAPTGSTQTLIGLLRSLGLFAGFPIAEGQTLSLSGAKQAGSVQIVVYDEYGVGDITQDMENGSDSNTYLYVNYGNANANINKTGDTLLNNSLTPAEFPDFPFGAVVPAGRRMELLGVVASDFSPGENNGTNYTLSTYLKLMKERTVLFDPDRSGMLLYGVDSTAPGARDHVGGGWSLIGNFSDKDSRLPYFFEPVLEFLAGDELLVYYTTAQTGTGQNIAVAEHGVGFILRVSSL